MDQAAARAPLEHARYRYLYTSVALAFAIAVLAAGLLWHINVFALRGLDIIGLEQSEVGEVMIAFLMVVPAFFVDRVVARQRAHEAELMSERLRVLRLTMRTVQDLVNNDLNQLQLLRIDAEGRVPLATLDVFDAAISHIAAQLTALGNMDVFAEKPMEMGPGLDCPTG